ncbi:MAG: glycosyltransferase family 2 protein [Acidimicrobiales bacterium]
MSAGAPGATVLVVTGHLVWPSLRADDRFTRDVIDGLVRLLGADALDVAALDGHAAVPAAQALADSGVDVTVGPVDWAGWLRARWVRYSHVVATGDALRYPVLPWLGDSQPSAAKVGCFDHLAWRTVRSRQGFVDPDEVEGLDLLAGTEQRNLAEVLSGFDAALFSARADADWAASTAGIPTAVISPRFGVPRSDPSYAERSGVAVFASAGYDISAGSEDAALMSLEAAGRLRETHPDVAVSVIGDRLSPRLKRAAAALDARSVAEADADGRLASSRLVLLSGRYGTAAVGPLLAAVDARTPVVATSAVAAAAGVDLVAEPWCSDDAPSMSAVARRLLDDETTWVRYHDSVDSYARRFETPAARYPRSLDGAVTLDGGALDGLQSLLVDLGVDAHLRAPAGTTEKRPPARARSAGMEASEVTAPPLRPGRSTPGLGDIDGGPAHPEDPDARYRVWQAAHAPTPEDLDVIAADAVDQVNPPTVSIIVTAGGAKPESLACTVESVLAQVYPHWELCIAAGGNVAGTEGAATEKDARIKVAPGGGLREAYGLAGGDYVAFVEAGGLLQAHALAQVARWVGADPALDVVYSDDDTIPASRSVRNPAARAGVHVKPDWSPDLLMSTNYIANLAVYKRSTLDAAGGIPEAEDPAFAYDVALRVTELPGRVGHIPEPLFTAPERSPAAEKPATPGELADPAVRALGDALERRRVDGAVEPGVAPGTYRVRYRIPGSPKVSIIIPTHNGVELLRACVDSIVERSTYLHYEIVVLDNRSDEAETLEYLAKAPFRVLRYPHPFNYARQMNLAAASCRADALVFLNDDTVVITPDWIEAMLEHAMRPEVGAVGCRLYYPDGRVQHEGILSGTVGWAWNIDHRGYFSRGDVIRNVSSVTGAATMTRPGVFFRVGGNDEDLRVAYNDVDLGQRIRQAGYRIVYTPYAELFHCEGGTRGRWEHPHDGVRFGKRWEPRTHVDPYYSPLFERDRPFVLAV